MRVTKHQGGWARLSANYEDGENVNEVPTKQRNNEQLYENGEWTKE